MEDNELITDAFKHETKEELGVDTNIGQLLALTQFEDDGCYSDPELQFHNTNGVDCADVDSAKISYGEKELADFRFFDIQSVHALSRELATAIPRLVEQHYQGPIIITSSLCDPTTC